jgi:hypothetical protein
LLQLFVFTHTLFLEKVKSIAKILITQEVYFKDELFDENGKLCEIQFGPIILPAPKEILPYIKRQYGENCLKEAYRQHDHIHEKRIKKIVYPIENATKASYIFWEGLPEINMD